MDPASSDHSADVKGTLRQDLPGLDLPGLDLPASSHPIQASTLSGFSSTDFWAASSGSIPSSAMYLATTFWSALVQLKFCTRLYAGLAASTKSVATILSRSYSG